jgi:hypothetical protein
VKKLGEKPTAAFVLSLIGAIFILINGLVVAAMFAAGGAIVGILLPGLGAMMIILGALAIVFGIIVIIGAIMINSGERNKVKIGSVLVLIFSIISLVAGGGFIIGFILCLIGSILGLVWKPAAEAPPPPPP